MYAATKGKMPDPQNYYETQGANFYMLRKNRDNLMYGSEAITLEVLTPHDKKQLMRRNYY